MPARFSWVLGITPMKLDIRDVRFEAIKGRGHGGQNVNKCANCIRATHEPTGIVVHATRERSLPQNKKAAIEELTRRLEGLAEARAAQDRRDRYDAKPDATFGNAVRVYRLVGQNQGIVDRRVDRTFPIDVLKRGKLDDLLSAIISQRKS